jgi:hypothetical protein
MVRKDKPFNLASLVRFHAGCRSQRDGIEPKLALSVRRADVDMRRLSAFVGVEVETEGTNPGHRGHVHERCSFLDL